jgi:uncharacterized integral membrane protein
MSACSRADPTPDRCWPGVRVPAAAARQQPGGGLHAHRHGAGHGDLLPRRRGSGQYTIINSIIISIIIIIIIIINSITLGLQVGGWISIWFNIATVIFLFIFDIPGIGQLLNYTLCTVQD